MAEARAQGSLRNRGGTMARIGKGQLEAGVFLLYSCPEPCKSWKYQV